MSAKNEERGVSAALGQIPRVNNQRAFVATITIAGTGLGDITISDIASALVSQHNIISAASPGNLDQMYIHEIRAYGSAGGYLSMAPYPHRQYLSTTGITGDIWINSYENLGTSGSDFRAGSLTQIYDFGISGATRPELKWSYPKDEVINNPFTIGVSVEDNDGSGIIAKQTTNLCKVITIQSTNTGGNALYIVQFDVTVRRSNFIEIAPALGAAAFGEKNVTTDNYLPPLNMKQRLEDGKKAEELANKKRKVENVKALTLPALDAH